MPVPRPENMLSGMNVRAAIGTGPLPPVGGRGAGAGAARGGRPTSCAIPPRRPARSRRRPQTARCGWKQATTAWPTRQPPATTQPGGPPTVVPAAAWLISSARMRAAAGRLTVTQALVGRFDLSGRSRCPVLPALPAAEACPRSLGRRQPSSRGAGHLQPALRGDPHRVHPVARAELWATAEAR